MDPTSGVCSSNRNIGVTDLAIHTRGDSDYLVVLPGEKEDHTNRFSLMDRTQRRRPRNRHVFVFHEPCWKLLKKVFHPREVPTERLHEVCSSLPIIWNTLAPNWGHQYGLESEPGAFFFEDGFPWEEPVKAVKFDFAKREPAWGMNPYRFPKMDGILAEEGDQQPPRPLALPSGLPSSTSSSTGGHDPFYRLSLELLSEVAMCLPTSDLLNVRLASRAFWGVFWSQQY
jgi:hypothetical protein